MVQLKSSEELNNHRQTLSSRRDAKTSSISVCAGTGCLAYGAAEVIGAFKAEIKKQGLTAKVDTKGTGCPGYCEKGPVVVMPWPSGVIVRTSWRSRLTISASIR